MRVTTLISAAVLLLFEISVAKEILYRPRGIRRRNLDDEMRKTAFNVLDERFERRQTSSSSITPTTSNIPDMNATISDACINELSSVASVQNLAGVTGCYNILQHDAASGMFQADLRLYLEGQASGAFANVAPSNMQISVTYPPTTSFSALMKRSIRPVARQSNGMSEMQQYTLMGTFQKTMDATKLNTTELMSLMVPRIMINSASAINGKAITTNVSTTDMAYFVVGDFKGKFTGDVLAPALQQAAITQSAQFVLPGTTFGIFPIGLIVTTAWMILFCIAYGAGTVGRYTHRKVFRQRKAAVGGRTGKRF
jgi:hypothetical protein